MALNATSNSFTKVKLTKKVSDQGLESRSIKAVVYTKDSGTMINVMVMDMKNLVMEIVTKENISIINHMEPVFTNGPTVRLTMAIGKMARKMAMEYGTDSIATSIWVNGKKIKLGATVYINGAMEINMKVTG